MDDGMMNKEQRIPRRTTTARFIVIILDCRIRVDLVIVLLCCLEIIYFCHSGPLLESIGLNAICCYRYVLRKGTGERVEMNLVTNEL